MKKLFILMLSGLTKLAVAQAPWPSLAISSVQVLPVPTLSNSNVKVVSTVSVGHSAYAGSLTVTISNFLINIKMCYAEYTDFFFPNNRTDTIPIGTLAPGNYSVSLTMFVYAPGDTCKQNNAVTALRTFTVLSSVGLSEDKMQSISIYPNPFKEKMVVDGLNKPFKYRVISLDGKTTEWIQSEVPEISGSQLPLGFYIVEILADNMVMRKKVLKSE